MGLLERNLTRAKNGIFGNIVDHWNETPSVLKGFAALGALGGGNSTQLHEIGALLAKDGIGPVSLRESATLSLTAAFGVVSLAAMLLGQCTR